MTVPNHTLACSANVTSPVMVQFQAAYHFPAVCVMSSIGPASYANRRQLPRELALLQKFQAGGATGRVVGAPPMMMGGPFWTFRLRPDVSMSTAWEIRSPRWAEKLQS
jgi:hypothetical protein